VEKEIEKVNEVIQTINKEKDIEKSTESSMDKEIESRTSRCFCSCYDNLKKNCLL
jgi:hypothetical protein